MILVKAHCERTKIQPWTMLTESRELALMSTVPTIAVRHKWTQSVSSRRWGQWGYDK